MANYSATFTTASADQDLLQLTAIKSRIKERLGISSDEEYAKLFAVGVNDNYNGITMTFDIIFDSANKISLNNGLYNDPIDGQYYSSCSYIKLYALKVQSVGSGTMIFQIK